MCNDDWIMDRGQQKEKIIQLGRPQVVTWGAATTQQTHTHTHTSLFHKFTLFYINGWDEQFECHPPPPHTHTHTHTHTHMAQYSAFLFSVYSYCGFGGFGGDRILVDPVQAPQSLTHSVSILYLTWWLLLTGNKAPMGGPKLT